MLLTHPPCPCFWLQPAGAGRLVLPVLVVACCLVLSVCQAPPAALASYEEIPAQPAASTPAAPGAVHCLGTPCAVPALVSQGRNIPFGYALSLLTPAGWLVQGAAWAPKIPVSWQDGAPWLATLERMANETGARLQVDYAKRTLTVLRSGDAVAASSAQSALQPAISPQPRPQPLPDTAARTADKPAATTPDTATQPRDKADRPADALLVSHPAGEGRVALARAMRADEAARVLTIPLRSFLAWNSLANAKVRLARGTIVWIRTPDKPASPKTAQAGARPAAVPKASAARQTAKPAPAAKADVAAARTPAAVQPAPAATLWQLAPGSLKAQLERWAGQAGYRVVWQADTDLELEAGADFGGDFAAAIRSLFEGLSAAGSPYTAHLFHGNRILQVEDHAWTR